MPGPKFVFAEQMLLTTLVVKLAVMAALATGCFSGVFFFIAAIETFPRGSRRSRRYLATLGSEKGQAS